MFSIGPHQIESQVILAPMAGVSDFPFREICRSQGAALSCAEMVTSKTELWQSRKSKDRLPDLRDPAPRPIQIAGSEPEQMAEAARRCIDLGAQLIDINMGCPAKKVCNKAAGSALLADEGQVYRILEAVVEAATVPVTLKTRLGPSPENENILTISQRAERIGISALTVHGRTRACKFKGSARYKLIGEVASALTIPVIVNGDITSPEKAKTVLQQTGAAAVMIGRGAWGQPWLLGQTSDFLQTGQYGELSHTAKFDIVLQHLDLIYQHYGKERGVIMARKHIDWYLERMQIAKNIRQKINRIDHCEAQQQAVTSLLKTTDSCRTSRASHASHVSHAA